MSPVSSRTSFLMLIASSSLVSFVLVEIISPSETVGSVNDKIAGYFSAGSQQIWVVYPKTRVVHVYTAINKVTILGVEDALSGGDILPGFTLNIGELFAVLN